MLYSLRTARTAMKPSMAFRFDVSRTRSSLRLMTVRVPLPTRACTCTSYSYSSITRTPMSNKLTLVRSLSSRIPHDSDEPRPPPPPLPQPQPEPKRGLIGGTIFAGSMLFGKTKYVLAALKVTKMAPLASMLITSATYSLFFGWPYAIGKAICLDVFVILFILLTLLLYIDMFRNGWTYICSRVWACSSHATL
jgi:hypothetical protein